MSGKGFNQTGLALSQIGITCTHNQMPLFFFETRLRFTVGNETTQTTTIGTRTDTTNDCNGVNRKLQQCRNQRWATIAITLYSPTSIDAHCQQPSRVGSLAFTLSLTTTKQHKTQLVIKTQSRKTQ